MTDGAGLTRRGLLGAATAVSGATVLGAAAPSKPLRILVLSDLGQGGGGAALAARMAVEELGGGRIGREVVVVSADAGGDPARAAVLVGRYIDEDGVAAVVLVPEAGAVALAVQTACRARRRVSLMCGPGGPDLSEAACSPTGFQWIGDDVAVARALAIGLRAQGVVACRVMAGRATDRAASVQATLLEHGISDGVGVSVFCDPAEGAGAAGLVVRLGQARFWAEGGDGVMTVMPYDWPVEGGAQVWVRRFFQRAGRAPETGDIACYEAVRHFLGAVALLGHSEGPVVARRMRALPVTGAFTRGAEIAGDGRVQRALRLVRVNPPGARRAAWDVFTTVHVVPPAQGARAVACAIGG